MAKLLGLAICLGLAACAVDIVIGWKWELHPLWQIVVHEVTYIMVGGLLGWQLRHRRT